MKKRLIGAALIAVILMVAFAACEDETVVVWPTASKASNVTAVQSADKTHVIITWDAAKDAIGYGDWISVQKDGKNQSDNLWISDEVLRPGTGTWVDDGMGGTTWVPPSWDPSGNIRPTNTVKVKTNDASGITTEPNTDVDKWLAIVTVVPSASAAGSDITAGSFKFGVKTRNAKPNEAVSDIAWSKPVSLTSP